MVTVFWPFRIAGAGGLLSRRLAEPVGGRCPRSFEDRAAAPFRIHLKHRPGVGHDSFGPLTLHVYVATPYLSVLGVVNGTAKFKPNILQNVVGRILRGEGVRYNIQGRVAFPGNRDEPLCHFSRHPPPFKSWKGEVGNLDHPA